MSPFLKRKSPETVGQNGNEITVYIPQADAIKVGRTIANEVLHIAAGIVGEWHLGLSIEDIEEEEINKNFLDEWVEEAMASALTEEVAIHIVPEDFKKERLSFSEGEQLLLDAGVPKDKISEARGLLDAGHEQEVKLASYRSSTEIQITLSLERKRDSIFVVKRLERVIVKKGTLEKILGNKKNAQLFAVLGLSRILFSKFIDNPQKYDRLEKAFRQLTAQKGLFIPDHGEELQLIKTILRDSAAFHRMIRSQVDEDSDMVDVTIDYIHDLEGLAKQSLWVVELLKVVGVLGVKTIIEESDYLDKESVQVVETNQVDKVSRLSAYDKVIVERMLSSRPLTLGLLLLIANRQSLAWIVNGAEIEWGDHINEDNVERLIASIEAKSK